MLKNDEAQIFSALPVAGGEVVVIIDSDFKKAIGKSSNWFVNSWSVRISTVLLSNELIFHFSIVLEKCFLYLIYSIENS